MDTLFWVIQQGVRVAAALITIPGFVHWHVDNRQKTGQPVSKLWQWLTRWPAVLPVLGLWVGLGQMAPAPPDKAALGVKRLALERISAACGSLTVNYLLTYSGPEGLVNRDRLGWEELSALADLRYSDQEWARIAPIYDRAVSGFDQVLVDTQSGYAKYIDDETASAILLARRRLGENVANLKIIRYSSFWQAAPADRRTAAFNAGLHETPRILGEICGAVTRQLVELGP